MNAASPLRILLVEDDELFRLGLSTRLEREHYLKVVAEAIDGESAIELANQARPDIILLDIGLPGIGGVEACRRIKQQHPDLPVLALTSHSQKSLIDQLINANASGFCLKGIEAEALILALQSVAAGATWWDKCSTDEIRTTFGAKANSGQNFETATAAESTESPKPNRSSDIDADASTVKESAKSNGANGFDQADDASPLTQREQEILALVAEGNNNQEIAEQLHIATGTVRVHVHAILKKLEVRDRTQAAIVALRGDW